MCVTVLHWLYWCVLQYYADSTDVCYSITLTLWCVLQYYADSNEAESWMKEKMVLVKSADYGKDESSAKVSSSWRKDVSGITELSKWGFAYWIQHKIYVLTTRVNKT